MRNTACLKPYPQRELLRILLNVRNIEITGIRGGERIVSKITIQYTNLRSILMHTVPWEPKGEATTIA